MKIIPDSMTEQIHKELRMDILTGKIPGGIRLAESTLAEEKGVSRTPVREALRQLAKEDLLYAIPRAGYLVKEFTELDIMDLFETRGSIELVAAQTAMTYISDKDLKLLEDNLMRAKEVIDNNETKKMADLDIEFHSIIYKAARSKYLYRICTMLSDYTLKFRRSVIIVPEIANRANEDHLEIYNALKSKEPLRLENAIRTHVKQVKTDVIEYLEKIRQESIYSE